MVNVLKPGWAALGVTPPLTEGMLWFINGSYGGSSVRAFWLFGAGLRALNLMDAWGWMRENVIVTVAALPRF